MENCILEILGEKFKCMASRPIKDKVYYGYNFGSYPLEKVDKNISFEKEINLLKLRLREEKIYSILEKLITKVDPGGQKYIPGNIDIKVIFCNTHYRVFDIDSIDEINQDCNKWDEYEIAIRSFKIEEINKKDDIYEALAQAYCEYPNQDKVLDFHLINSMTKKIKELWDKMYEIHKEEYCSKISK